jgi:hypothetical protein
MNIQGILQVELKPIAPIPGLEWIILVALLITMFAQYYIVYKVIQRRLEKVRAMTKEEREGILKGIYYLPEKLPKYMNPRIWEILMLIFVIALLIIFW